MLIPQEYHPYIYDLFLKQVCRKSILQSPLFLLPLEHFLLQFLLLTVIITFPPSYLRRWIFFPLSVLHLIKSPLCYIPLNSDPLTKLSQALVLSQLFNMTFNLLCSEKYIEFTDYRLKKVKLDSHNVNDYDAERFNHLSFSKFKWSLCRCFANIRGVGWNFQVKSVVNVPSKKHNRWTFIFFKCFLYELLFKFLFYDFSLFILNLLKFEDSKFSNYYISLIYSLVTYSSTIRLLCKHLAATINIYYGLNSAYWCLAALSMSFGLTNVDDWPNMFNFGLNGFSMKDFWSFWWHQYITRDSYLISKRLVGLLKLNKDSYLKRYFNVITTFLICGCLHAFASISLDWNINEFNPNVPSFIPEKSIFNKCFYSLFLFIYSAHIVILEDIMNELYISRLTFLKKGNWKLLSKIVGCTWIIVVQAWPVVMYIEELEMGGLYFPLYHYPFTLSVFIN